MSGGFSLRTFELNAYQLNRAFVLASRSGIDIINLVDLSRVVDSVSAIVDNNFLASSVHMLAITEYHQTVSMSVTP